MCCVCVGEGIHTTEVTDKSCFWACAVPWCPYWENLRQAWSRRDHPNMCFLVYEDMKQVRLELDE